MTSRSQLRTAFLVVLGIFFGVPTGTAVATFIYADGLSYLSKRPEACINCHVMKSQYDSWQASSHHTFARCNDCHSNGNILSRYIQKGINGFNHSFAFTTGYFHEPIRIKNFNLAITKRACLECHSQLVHASEISQASLSEKNCLNCHREVGHRK